MVIFVNIFERLTVQFKRIFINWYFNMIAHFVGLFTTKPSRGVRELLTITSQVVVWVL